MDDPAEVPRPRGEAGPPGHCLHCDTWAPEGPDPCLGWIPGVAQACCGHGDVPRAFVHVGCVNPKGPKEQFRYVTLKEQDALDFFALIKRGQWIEPRSPG